MGVGRIVYTLVDTIDILSQMDGTVTAILELRDGSEQPIHGSAADVSARLAEIDHSPELRDPVKAVRLMNDPRIPADTPGQ